MKNRSVGVVVLTGLGALAYLGFSTAASSAQTGAGERSEAPVALERKVERLEERVATLQKEVEELKRRPVPVTFTAPFGQAPPSEPPGTPFVFNDRTYYWVPLQQGNAGALSTGGAVAVEVTPAK